MDETVDEAASQVEAFVRSGLGLLGPCERIERTSISWLAFFDGVVLKLKTPVRFDFVDFSTPQRRLWAARREVAFNQATAPDLYQGVIEIRRDAQGHPGLGGAGELLDAAVRMRRFDEDALLARRLPLEGDFAEALGRRIAELHAAAPLGAAGAGAAGLDYVVRSNASQLRQCAGVLGEEPVEDLIGATDRAFARAAPVLDARAAAGLCRACHGDLHLSNILVLDGAPVPFDAIEFNDALREIDVGYDIAFLLMDLGFRGANEAANRAWNGWLDEAARSLGVHAWRTAAVLPLFQSVRAAVRAHVRAREEKPQEARAYLAAARSWLAHGAPRLLAVGGLSGSGKTRETRRLAPRMGAAPGAVVLRSDEVRKRQAGAAPRDRLAGPDYSPTASDRVYDELEILAGALLGDGAAVAIDAAFLEPDRRAAIEAVARCAGAPFEGVWLQAPEGVLRKRIEARQGDASDATVEVLERQLRRDLGPISWRAPPSEAIEAWAAGEPAAAGLTCGDANDDDSNGANDGDATERRWRRPPAG